jgi:NAD(P)H-flavin reductase
MFDIWTSSYRTHRSGRPPIEAGVHCAGVPIATVSLAEILDLTPRSRLVRLDWGDAGFEFQPGQAVMVGEHGGHEQRPYSIASSPERTAETGRLELLIASERDGTLGAHLGPAVPGARVDVSGPLGTFTVPRVLQVSRVLLVAGGTGIAPLRSMLDHLLRREPAIRLSLLYSARRADEFAFMDEFERHARTGRLELHRTVTRDDTSSWTGGRGRIGRAHFEAVLHDPANTLCFVCGPEPLVVESVATLKNLGVPEAQIRTEEWAR